jgi:hypothetical protein
MLQRRFLAAAITSMALAGIDTTGAAQGAKRAEKPGWVNLFDGATLNGWGDFDAEFEVLTHTGANSGVYFHTAFQDRGWPDRGFEMQVNNTQPLFPGDTGAAYIENKKTGSLYGIRNTYKALARDNE